MGGTRSQCIAPGMNLHSNLDRESFQRLLSNAFAVQQSQMDTRSLSAIVEVQRLITSGDFDVDGAIHLIADRTRIIANANGVAIGLLKGNRLVYQAGSGSAAQYIGRQLTATLSVPAEPRASCEILRVENAQTDARIEAAICRQFGAESLIMLLIYRDRAVAGVLEILFSEAHHFEDREVRTYRLMAGLVGDAMSHAVLMERNKAAKTEPSSVPHAIEQMTHQTQTSGDENWSLVEPPSQDEIHEAPSFWQMPAASATFAQRFRLAERLKFAQRLKFTRDWNFTQRLQRHPLHGPRWNMAVVAVVTVLVLTSWIAYASYRRNRNFGASTPQTSNAIDPETIGASKPQAASVTTEKPKVAAKAPSFPRRVRVGENEVDYISDDVTIRYFTPQSPAQRAKTAVNQVNIGDDVTVRYFTHKSTAAPRPVATAEEPANSSLPVQPKSVSRKLER